MATNRILILATQDGIIHIPVQSNGQLGSVNQTLQGTSLEAVCVDASGKVFAGAEDGRIFRSENGEKWHQVFSGFGSGQTLWALTAHPVRPSELYAGLEPAAIWLSWDAGENCEEITAFRTHPSSEKWRFYEPSKPHIRSIAFSRDGSLLYVGIEEGGVLVSGDGGKSFEDRTGDIDPDLHVIAVTHADPGLAYAMTGGGLYRTRNAGVRWERMGEGLDRTYVVPMGILAADGKTLCVGAAGRTPGKWRSQGADAAIYRSEDWGGSWNIAQGPFPLKGMVASIVIDPVNREHLLAGTNDGMLLQSTDLGKSWEVINQDLPRIEEMVFHLS